MYDAPFSIGFCLLLPERHRFVDPALRHGAGSETKAVTEAVVGVEFCGYAILRRQLVQMICRGTADRVPKKLCFLGQGGAME